MRPGPHQEAEALARAQFAPVSRRPCLYYITLSRFGADSSKTRTTTFKKHSSALIALLTFVENFLYKTILSFYTQSRNSNSEQSRNFATVEGM
ncbi:hypothetical protein TNCV_1257201 [Trichonephila clavipes]|nr:hypothetical protein TNCV_1257201 [Trichonephila clavipes]